MGVILHTLIVALLHCPPLLAFACSCLSYARDSFYGPSSSPDHHHFSGGLEPGLGVGVGEGKWASEVCEAEEAFGGGGGEVLGVYGGSGGREMVCMEVDW